MISVREGISGERKEESSNEKVDLGFIIILLFLKRGGKRKAGLDIREGV